MPNIGSVPRRDEIENGKEKMVAAATSGCDLYGKLEHRTREGALKSLETEVPCTRVQRSITLDAPLC